MFLVSVLFFAFINTVSSNSYGLVPDMYCGLEICYDVLDVSYTATKGEISKKYRKLAREYHPDYLQSHGASKEEIEIGIKKFHTIAVAYETLRDSREEYDYYLEHPEEYYYNYYRYYSKKIPNVDVRIVIFGSITVVSVFQYISWMSSYHTAISYLAQNSKYRSAAKEEAKRRGIWLEKSEHRKKNRNITKEEIKEEEETLIRSIIEEKMDIRGAYQKPAYTDVLWMKLFLFPYFLAQFFWFHIKWIYDYNFMRKEFTDEAKHYLICKYIGLSTMQWDMLTDLERQSYMKKQLWIKKNAEEYKKEKEEEARIKMAHDPKMKRYRRWMNRGGPGQMTFMEE